MLGAGLPKAFQYRIFEMGIRSMVCRFGISGSPVGVYMPRVCESVELRLGGYAIDKRRVWGVQGSGCRL